MIAVLPVTASLALLLAGGDRVEDWTEDVLHLVAEIERMHPQPFQVTPREEFEQAIDAFLGGIEARGDEELAVELMRLVALFTRGTRDGHSFVWSTSFRLLPLQLYRFDDGWFVVAAQAPNAGLVGARVVAIGSTPVEEAAQRILPIVMAENEWDARTKLELMLRTPAILKALGIVPDASAVALRLEGAKGVEEVVLRPDATGPLGAPLPAVGDLRAYRERGRSWWSEVLEGERALYVQYNAVRAVGDGGETLADFAAGLVRTFHERGLERLVLDLRSNGGGDNTTFGPLVDALRGDEALNKKGKLFALIGRSTFSAAGNFVTVIDRDTEVLLVGEPTGGAPNQFGDARAVALPHHRDVLVHMVTRHHSFGGAKDLRVTQEPDVRVPLSSADYFAGRDPVLERALTFGRN